MRNIKNCKGVLIFNANDTDIRIELLRNATENLSRKPLWEMETQVSVILRETIIIKVRRRAGEGSTFSFILLFQVDCQ